MAENPEHPPVSLYWLNRRLIIVVVIVAAITSLVVGGAVALTIQAQANKAIEHDARVNAINGCDGSNLLRGFARLATHRFRPTLPDPTSPADYLLRIRDCEATYTTGHVVVLTAPREYAFLVHLAHGQRVAVRDGGARFEPIP